ncbi:MAG: HTH-type transcriptional repressor RghR [Pelotomaculum sp. PtaB.Bin104]|nr:MAG: HTH-type transcriptional repressor RghR [Pelotomaculum sp. PtaB.Bin104]
MVMGKSFGGLLKELREKQSYSINKLSEKSGVSTAHLSRLENKRRNPPSPKTIKKISRILGSYSELMDAAGYGKLSSSQAEQVEAGIIFDILEDEEILELWNDF